MLKVLFAMIPSGVAWVRPMPIPIHGGFAFTRETQPAAMKFALPLRRVPTSVTGIGMNTLRSILTCFIHCPPFSHKL
jgi:hypothetical protein